ncbi:hypothetical protein [Nocardia sp. NPDC005998]|uniref:aromatic-ring hydroxylase C-terminal domain-containing protein n=1 Tax=Nocardia sp. NPDC005998 TaxID=3156894 RepID=UPI0033A36DFA
MAATVSKVRPVGPMQPPTREHLQAVLRRVSGSDVTVRYAAEPARNALGLSAVLVRPDGIVAWASDRDDPDPGAFEQAADRWFGRPA